MKALIDPQNNRVCEVRVDSFPVAEPLFFTVCRDDCIPDFDYWDPQSNTIVYPERPEPAPAVDLIGTTVEEF